jgi:hypothetical protein
MGAPANIDSSVARTIFHKRVFVYESLDLDLQEALQELERYFSDELAPLMVTGAIDSLLRVPPSVAATAILGWTQGQSAKMGAPSSVSDYYFHALKKLHLMGEFKLVPQEQLKSYLDDLAQLLVEAAPPEEQESLRASVVRLGEVRHSMTAQVNLAPRPDHSQPQGSLRPSGVPSAVNGLSPEALRGIRRFTLLLERLHGRAAADLPTGAVSPGAQSEDQEALLSQILTTAAISSHSSHDLTMFLERLREMGLKAHTREIFQALAQSLPGWIVPGAKEIPGAAAPVEAMRKIVSMERSPAEGASRFGELIRVSIETFNEGSLAQAAQMFGVAHNLIAEKKVDVALVQRIRDTAHEDLSEERLREYAASADTHGPLRQVMAFFPALSASGLFEMLADEPKRERRRLLIDLLEAQGSPARTQALETLKSRGSQMHHFIQRNLFHILRRIPRPTDASMEEELALVSEYSHATYEPIVAREAIAVLATMRHERSEAILLERLKEYERTLLSQGRADAIELQSTLDRIVAALARTGTTSSIRSIVEHGLSRKAPLGDTTARLTELAGQDLSSDEPSVKRLLAALKDDLPKKVLGIVLQRSSEMALRIIKALSGTPSDEVRVALEEIVQRFPDGDLGGAAADALAWLGQPSRATEPAAATLLSGDLGLFSLPNLIQSLADAGVTGILTLIDQGGGVRGAIVLESARMRDCQVGSLRGSEAFYQLFEKPANGSFTVKGRPPGAADAPDEAPPSEIMGLLMEAMRRHDEYRSACAIVPDDLAYRPTGSKPSRPKDEGDTELLRRLWTMVQAGTVAIECEDKAAVDAYRVRRILSHWLEEGAIQPYRG